ncbi:MAG: alpha/beta hydrolase fold protein [Nitrospirae bacterium]|nr:MAG: alpha/beta hydrolase fold protein [Nitrospirota bacterium]
MLKALKPIIAVAALVYLGLCAYYYALQGRMIYLPDTALTATPNDIGLNYENITLNTADGLALFAWFVPAPKARATLLFCHGNAGNISNRLDSIRIMHSLGLNVLIFDYRGFGQSEGEPDEQGTYADADAAWDHLVGARKIAPQTIVIFGHSLGSSVAAETAMRHRDAGGLILESGFISLSDIGKKILPYLPIDLLLRYKYATGEKVGKIHMPKLIIHSPDDEVIPFQHGIELYRNASHPKYFLEIRGSHNSGFLTSGEIYTDGLDRFIAGIAGAASKQ